MQDQLREAIELIKAGEKAQGKRILLEILSADEKNEAAWLWMSAAVDTDDMRRECLEEVLKINPSNQSAIKGLARLSAPARVETPVRESSAYPDGISSIETSYRSSVSRSAVIPPVDVEKELVFKYAFTVNGMEMSLFGSKGYATAEGIELSEDLIPYAEIVDTLVRDKCLTLQIRPGSKYSKRFMRSLKENCVISLTIFRLEAAELKRHIDIICSHRKAEQHREQLTQAGKGDKFRFEVCPECHAIVDLSELNETPFTYCRFCETIFDRNKQVITDGSMYQVCHKCGMFDRVRGYDEVYFYFLLVVYGFYSKRVHVCDNCANKIFIRTFFLNLLFLIGIPSSIAIKIKSMTGRDPYLRTLAKANSMALKGRIQEAVPIYKELRMRYPDHPGLLMNEGIGYLMANNTNAGAGQLRRALIVCSNYLPVIRLLQKLQGENAGG